MSRIYKDLKWKNGQVNAAGIKSKLFYMDKDDIAKFPTMKDAPTDVKDAVSYDGNIEMKTDKFAIEIYTTQGNGSLSFEEAGEKDCAAFNNKGEFNFPDMNDEAVNYVNNSLNSNGIIIAAHYTAGGGVVHVMLGHKEFDAEIKKSGTTGSKIGDSKGIKIEVTAPDFKVLPRYTGTIKLESGIYDCSTGDYAESGTP